MNLKQTNRHGFTLVEVMLTTVLAAVLLLALWSLLSMYSKSFESGNARTEQAQLVRAILDQLTADLKNVLVSASDLSSMESGFPAAVTMGFHLEVASESLALPGAVRPVSTEIEPGGDSMAESSTPSTIVSSSSLRLPGLFGTNTSLQVDVVQPAVPDVLTRDEPKVAVGLDIPPAADELRTIVYSFEEQQDSGNLLVTTQSQLVRHELSWPQAHPARDSMRSETIATGESTQPGDFATGESARMIEVTRDLATDSSGIERQEPGSSSTIIPEVFDFALRYFDGTAWFEEWDSISRGGLPLAVEVTLRTRPGDEPHSVAQLDIMQRAGVERERIEQARYPAQRMVIPLALAARGSVKRVDSMTMESRAADSFGAHLDDRSDR